MDCKRKLGICERAACKYTIQMSNFLEESQDLRSHLVVFLLFLVFFSSCSDNSYDYGYDKYYEEIVTVIGKHSFRLDSGETLISRNMELNSNIKEGDRVLLHYTLLNETTAGYDYTVRVNAAQTISLGELLLQKQVSLDTIPDVPIRFESAWIGSHYLNLQFYMEYHSTAHSVGLYADSLKMENDTIRLYFKHNTNGDPSGYPVHMYVSFDLKKKLGEPQKEKPLVLDINTSNYGRKEYEFVY